MSEIRQGSRYKLLQKQPRFICLVCLHDISSAKLIMSRNQKKEELVLDDAIIQVKIDMSLLVDSDDEVKVTVRVSASTAPFDLLRKLLVSILDSQKLKKHFAGRKDLSAHDFSLRHVARDVYLEDTASLSENGVKEGDFLQIRVKKAMTVTIRRTTGEEHLVTIDGARKVEDYVASISDLFQISSTTELGLRVADRPEFLVNNQSFVDQRVPNGCVLLMHKKKCFGVRLEDITPADRVPVLVQKSLQFIEEKGLDLEGIYRLSGSAMHISMFKDVFDKGEVPNYGLYQVDAHVVAGLLKLFLREMEEPCIPFALYDKFLEVSRSDKSQKACMKRYRDLISKLPAVNYHLLQTLMVHFAKVASYSKMNLMPTANLAALLGPNLFRSAETDNVMRTLQDTPALNQVVKVFMEEYEYLFNGVEKEYNSVSARQQKAPTSQQLPTVESSFPDDLVSPTRDEPSYENADLSALDDAQVIEETDVTRFTVGQRCSALYSFTAKDSDELSIEEGQVVTVLRDHSDWVMVRTEDTQQEGLVPVAYLSPLEAPPEEAILPAHNATDSHRSSRSALGGDQQYEHQLAQENSHVKHPPPRSSVIFEKRNPLFKQSPPVQPMSSPAVVDEEVEQQQEEHDYQDPIEDVIQVVAEERTERPRHSIEVPLILARVLYNYNKQETNELELTVGDFVNILQQPNNDWWLGTDGEATGLFPASYVELVDMSDVLVQQDPRTTRLSQRMVAMGDTLFPSAS